MEDTERLKSICQLLAQAQRVVVVVGAGISTASGISDFRSSTGIYTTSSSSSSASSAKDLFSTTAFVVNLPILNFWVQETQG